MSQGRRILIAVVVLIVIAGAVLGIEALRRGQAGQAGGETTLEPGAIPIYRDGALVASFSPGDLEALEQVSFVDDEEGKTQEGWLLRDVLLLHLSGAGFAPDTAITVTSSSRDKTAALTWAEVADPENRVMFDVSGRGTLKLVSVLERLDVRDEWVQDVDRIDIGAPES